jgi:hypothetical protein
MKTDQLIAALAVDGARPSVAQRRVGAIAVGAALVLALLSFAVALGPRPDFAVAAGTVRFLFKFAVTIALAVPALGLTLALARPNRAVRGWIRALWIAPALLVLAVAAELAVAPADGWTTRLVGQNALVCLTIVPLLSAMPLAILLIALRHGAPDRAGRAGAAAGLGAAGIAAALYAANCNDDSPLFVAAWYPLAIALVAGTGAAIGRRFLRW